MGCWLVTDPEEILKKTGDYSNIKIIAKYGARVGQTLTSTTKTIRISEECVKYHKDDIQRNNYLYQLLINLNWISLPQC